MASRRSITQADVARAAGVSTASVSRVLNGSDLVSPEVRRRIETAMADLDYVPNETARALALRHTRVLGAIIPTLNNAIFAEGINAFEQAARQRGYTLLLAVSNYDLEEERHLVRNMIERGVEGLQSAGLRHVCTWTYAEAAPAPNVGFSNTAAVAALVDHLVGLGHRRIAMLSGLTATNDRARERMRGVRERVAGHSLDLPAERIIEIPYSIRAARRVFPSIMASKPTAVICGNDVIAFGAVFEAKAMGLSVPGDVSITGFDNLNLSSELDPPITTVDVPAEQMGAAAANALADAIEGDCEVVGQSFETKLLVRGTTGPAPS